MGIRKGILARGYDPLMFFCDDFLGTQPNENEYSCMVSFGVKYLLPV